MGQQARVTSVEALEAFRSHLIVYVSQARPALEEVGVDVLRARLWLENDQQLHWQREIVRRRKVLDEAQQALFGAKLGQLRMEHSAEQLAVHRARRALDEAETKLRVVKKWAREYDNRLQPMLKQTEKLETILSHDLAKAVAYLAQVITTLSVYQEKPK